MTASLPRKTSKCPEECAEDIIQRLIRASTELSPQRRKAAKYLIDHPDDVAVVPLRQLADSAGVKASTLVRLAAAIGYPSFSQMRLPFRAQLRIGEDYISERAQQLESQGRQKGKLYAGMAQSVMTNLELLFSQDLAVQLTEVAKQMVAARRVIVTAVGSGYGLAHQFYYVGRMALPSLELTPPIGGLPVDDLIGVGPRDMVLLLSFQPYRRETIDAANLARARGATVVAITDSRTSPIALPADTVFVVPTDTPQFFPSMSAVLSLLETLVALIVTQGGKKVVGNVNAFSQTRRDFNIWWNED